MTKALLSAGMLMALLLSFSVASAGEIEPNFAAYLETLGDDDFASAIVYLQDRPNIGILDAVLHAENAPMQMRHETVVTVLKDAARRSQPALLGYLDTRVSEGTIEGYTPYWIMNLVVVSATKAELEVLAERPDVEAIEENFKATLIESVGEPYMGSPTVGIRVTSGLRAINADRVWYELGYTGAGTLIAGLDTGVDGTHPALSDRWRGNWHPWNECWRDALGGGTTFPTDYHGHGTHTMGTMCGAAHATGDTVGVAFEALWIADNSIDQGAGPALDNDVIGAFQWFADPDGDSSTTDDIPDVVQNSWGVDSRFGYDYNDCDYRWQEVIENCEAAGVVVTFSAGNEGPVPQSHRSPANICDSPTVNFSVGAVDCENYGWPYPIADFSSRGPSDCDGVSIKPEVCGPGVDVYSSYPGGSYLYASGTSMAGPHVAGVVALMRQANPDADVQTIKEILMQTARDLGTVGEENTYGWGVIDAYEAVLTVAEPDSIPPGAVTDLMAINPTSNTMDLSWTASGDDGNEGTAAYYDVRYSTSPITEVDFSDAPQAPGAPEPGPPGTLETMTLAGLDFETTYYFAVKVRDEFRNYSPMSNLASGTTLGIPHVAVDPTSMYMHLLTGGTASQALNISNVGEGTLDFGIEISYVIPAWMVARFPYELPSRTVGGDHDGDNNVMQPYEVFAHPITILAADLSDVTVAYDISHGQRGSSSMSILVADLVLRGADFYENTVPLTGETLSGVDILWLDDGAGTAFAAEELEAIEIWLNEGGAIFQHGDEQGTAAAVPEPYGIQYGGSGVAGITPNIAAHAVTDSVDAVYVPNPLASLITSGDSQTIVFDAGGLDHAAVVEVGAGRIFVVADDDFFDTMIPEADNRVLGNNAIDWLAGAGHLAWLSVDPWSGRVLADSTMELGVIFDATGLFGGGYDADIVVLSNDPDSSELRVPVHLDVTGAPDVSVSSDSLDYGGVFIGVSVTDTVFVSNVGTDSLVVSDIGVDHSDYSVDPVSFTLEPTASETVLVTFSPSTAGHILGTLTVTSNDHDEPTVLVSLVGEGLVPPDIWVSPDSLSDSLFTGGVSVHTLTIGNTGGSDLYFDISLGDFGAQLMAPGPGPIVSGGSLEAAGRPPLLTQPGDSAWSDESPAGYEPALTEGSTVRFGLDDMPVLVIQDAAPWGSYANEAILQLNGIGYDMINSSEIGTVSFDDYAVVLVPSDQPTSFYQTVASFEDRFADYVAAGGVLEFHASGWGWNGGDASLVTLPGGVGINPDFWDVNYVLDPSHPVVAGVPNPFYGTGASHAYLSDLPVDALLIVEDGGGNENLVEYTYGMGTVIASGQTLEFGYDRGQGAGIILFNMIPYAYELGRINWLSVEPSSGTVPAGSSVDVAVTFDATGLYGGGYDADIVVSSNDPDESEVVVPAHLHVTGAPDIVISPDSLDYGPVFIGVSVTDTVFVSNVGTDSLVVSDIGVDHSDYSVDPVSFTLEPAASETVLVTFSPSTAGHILGTLTVTSNDDDEPTVLVSLVGEGLVPPDIWVSPDSLSDSLYTNETSVHTLTIGNTGGSDLTFEVEIGSVEGLLGLASEVLSGLSQTGEIEVDGLTMGAFTDAEVSEFRSRLQSYYQQVEDLLVGSDLVIPRVAVVGGGRYDILYYLLADSSLAGRYEFVEVGDYSDYTLIEGYDGLVVCEYDYGIDNSEALSLASFYDSGKPLILGMDDLDDNFYYYPGTDSLLMPVFGVSGVSDGSYSWGSLNPANPITEGISQVYDGFNDGDNDRYVRGGADWIFAGTDGYPYGVSYEGQSRTVVMGEFLASIWWAGNGQLIANAIDWMMEGVEWLSVLPESGTVPAGSSVDVAVTFDATGLYGGGYDADIVVLSNDPDESEVMVPAHLHVTGVPDISVSPDSLDFGTVYLGVSEDMELEVLNEGTDSLRIIDIAVGSTDYSVDTTAFVLAPNEGLVVTVKFAPSAEGDRSSTLTVFSNDHDEPAVEVPLIGFGLVPPDISVSPTSLADSLYVGQTSTHPLRIENSGGSDLDFRIEAGLSPGVEQGDYQEFAKDEIDPRTSGSPINGSGGPDMYGYRWIDSDEPGGPAFDWIDITGVGTPIPLSGDDYNLGPYPVGFDFPFYGNSFSTFRICTNGFVSFTSSSAAFSNQPLPNTSAPGNLLSVFWDDLYFDGSSEAYYYHDGTKTVIEFKDVPRLGGGGIYTFEIILYPGGKTVYQYLSMVGTVTSATIGIQNATGTDGLQVVFNAPYVHDNLAIRFSTMPQWLSVDPAEGTVPAGAFADVSVGFDAVELSEGDYLGLLSITSNDPDESLVGIPCSLHVMVRPEIDVYPAALDFGPVYIGLGDTLGVVVCNRGSALLEVTSLTIDEAQFTTDPAPFNLDPGDSVILQVAFAPVTEGVISGNLTISSNDQERPEVDVVLSGIGVIPPEIETDPDSLKLAAMSGMVKQKTLRIANTGGSDLVYDIFAFQYPPPAENDSLDVPKGEEDPRYGDPVITGHGGPDNFGHIWRDSDEPGGPVFDWVDITGIGTPIPITGDDANAGPYPIGFDFQFYRYFFDTFRICTNGFVSFTSTQSPYLNRRLPSMQAPHNLLAIFWDDLNFRATSHAYYHYDGTRTIIEFENVYRGDGGWNYTFEIILEPDGDIKYQYLSMDGRVDRATVGIQNASRLDGLQIVFNAPYLHDSLAVEISLADVWLSASPEHGTVPAGGFEDVTVTCDARALDDEYYPGVLRVSSNDIDEPVLDVPVDLNVGCLIADYLDVDPNTLNLGSQGRWVNCTMGLPPGYDPYLVLVETVFLTAGGDSVMPPEVFHICDPDSDGLYDLEFKFNRQAVQAILPEGDSIAVMVAGEIDEITYVAGWDTIRIIHPQVTHPNGGEEFAFGASIIATWEIPGGAIVDSFAVHFSSDAGESWQEIVSGVTELSVEIPVPAIETTLGLIGVQTFVGGDIVGFDASDSTFTILAPEARIPDDALPIVFALRENVPNPFAGTTTLRFDLPRDVPVRLFVSDVRGRLVREIVDKTLPAGRYSIAWDGRDTAGKRVASGVYYYTIEAGMWTDTKRMVLTR